MQGLPFDDSEFPPPNVSMSSTWIDQSPRLVPPQPQQQNPVTDEDLYRIVAANPAPPQDVIPRFSSHIHPHQQPLPPNHSVPLSAYHQSLPSHPSHPSASQQRPIPPPPDPAHPTLPRRRLSVPARLHKPDPRANPAAPISLVHQDHPEPPPLHSQPLPHSAHSIPTQTQQPHQPPGLYPPQDHSKQRKPVRSAVEEARLRAQREAESFANSRRDPAKREASITVPAAAAVRVDTWEGGTGVTERRPKRIRTDDISEARRSNSKSSHDKDEKKEEDSEVEKQERYKRRLDMNRESAAVSRVRRRAYVKELEERLAAVEAEKLQLEGKLEIMQSQNDGFKKQLEHLFLMVASGRRPTYPPQPPPAQTQNAPTQSQPPPGGQQGGTAEPPSQ